MRKFTVFTVILTLIVVVVAAQVVANQYWPSLDLASITGTDSATNPLPNSLNLSANVLGADGQPVNPVETSGLGLDPSDLPPTEFGDGLDVPSGASDITGLDVPGLADPINQSNSFPQAPISSTADDFESNTYKPAVLSVYLNQDQLKSAGFTNTTIDTEDFDGFLYKTIYLQDLEDLKIFKNVIKSVDSMIAKIYIIDVGPMNSPKTVYDTLKTRGSEGLDIEVNETGEFGDGSFYMNDSRRQNVAFLTVRFGSLIYGFSYPKEYHPQVKNLVKLLDMEF